MARSVADLLQDIEQARAQVLSVAQSSPIELTEVPIAEGKWSPVQYVEHLVRAEEITVWRMFKAIDDSRSRGEIIGSPTPDATIEEIVARTWAPAEQAPPLAVPRLGGPLAYWLTRLRLNSALATAFTDLVDPNELDAVAYPHPISGAFTMRQGLEFIRFHMDRHRGHLMSLDFGRSDQRLP